MRLIFGGHGKVFVHLAAAAKGREDQCRVCFAMAKPAPGDLLCTTHNPAAALKDLAVWGPLIVHYGVMVYDDYDVHAVERGLIKTKFDDRTWPMQGKRISSSPDWYTVSSHGRAAADHAEGCYQGQVDGEYDWESNFLRCNCEHFARLMCEGQMRSTQEAALNELQRNMAGAKPLKGVLNGIRQLNDAPDSELNGDMRYTTGHASVNQGGFRASVSGPSASAGARLNEGAGAMARASAGRASAGIDGIGSVHAGLSADTGYNVDDRNVEARVLGFGFSAGSNGFGFRTLLAVSPSDKDEWACAYSIRR